MHIHHFGDHFSLLILAIIGCAIYYTWGALRPGVDKQVRRTFTYTAIAMWIVLTLAIAHFFGRL